MRFLICGSGSVGQRHYKNLKLLGHEVALYRSGKNTGYNAPFLEKFFKDQETAGAPVKIFWNFEEALKTFNPDAVFVANPNARHMDVALPAARTGKHLFIEKPVSHNLDGLEELQKLQRQHNLKIMIGYNLRFHPLLQKMKELLSRGAIGQPLAAHVEMGENIEDWHPWEDYRMAYASQKNSGGGAVLCFSHDIDYLYWMLGKPDKIFAVGGKITPLGGDAEDVIKSLWEFPGGVIASVDIDYWQRPPRRLMDIVGTEGKLMWDYYAKTLTLLSRTPNAKPQIFELPAGFDRNDTFIAEEKNFIEAIQKNREPAVSLKDSMEVLRISLMIKKQIGF
jgi:predicted dehydrogenase